MHIPLYSPFRDQASYVGTELSPLSQLRSTSMAGLWIGYYPNIDLVQPLRYCNINIELLWVQPYIYPDRSRSHVTSKVNYQTQFGAHLIN